MSQLIRMTSEETPGGGRRWRVMTDPEVEAQLRGEQLRYLGERADPTTLTDAELAAELEQGEAAQRGAMAEVRARAMTQRAGVAEMTEAGRYDRAWSRRAHALEVEQARRERGALDFATGDSTRRAVLAMRAAFRGRRIVSITPGDDVAGWDALTTDEAISWLSVLRTVEALR